MLFTLAFRQALVQRRRSLFLLLGYALGAGVMIVLLSVGEAMLEQSRDVSLVGGGEVTVLPEGIDVEALRTGGLGGMFFTVDRARYVVRQGVGGPRYDDVVATVSPVIEGKLVYLVSGRDTVSVRAGGEIPSRARAVGAGLSLVEGSWTDSPADSQYAAPTAQQLYDEIDRFHYPTVADSTWGEWHYFNVVAAPDEWFYVSFLVGGMIPGGRWGGQVLVTHRRPDGRYEKLEQSFGPERIVLDTAGADLAIGDNRVEQRDGVYRVSVNLAGLRLGFTVSPAPHHYFPPVQLREGEYTSGYAVAALRATARGEVCRAGRCRAIESAPAYHDHNWGVWRDVTWEWGAAAGSRYSFLYGQVQAPDSATAPEPFFFALVDSLGVRQVLRSTDIRYEGEVVPVTGGDVTGPARFSFVAGRERDTVRVRVEVREAAATRMGAASFDRYFLQMRGSFTLEGSLDGVAVADSGSGFFETWRLRPPAGPSR